MPKKLIRAAALSCQKPLLTVKVSRASIVKTLSTESLPVTSSVKVLAAMPSRAEPVVLIGMVPSASISKMSPPPPACTDSSSAKPSA